MLNNMVNQKQGQEFGTQLNNLKTTVMNNNIQPIPTTKACYKAIIDACIDLVSMKDLCIEQDEEGFITELSKYCNLMGLQRLPFIELLRCNHNISGEYIENYIESTYEKNKSDFGLLAFFSKTHICRTYQPDSKSSPKIPQEVYDRLPPLLSRCFAPIKGERQRDMFLLSALTVIGGCLDNYSGLYDGKVVFPSLYNFVVAPAASGKGVMSYAKKLTDMLQVQINEENYQAALDYKVALSDYASGDIEDEPEKPGKKTLFVPGNSTTAAIMNSFINSDGRLILFETEADSVASSKGQFNTGFSEILRCAFQHETIATNRKCNDGIMEIQAPKLSISISGTENQVIGLIKSAENGLFSRFMYYSFNEPLTFKDVSPNNKTPNHDLYYEGLAHDFLNLFNSINQQRTTFSLTPTQWTNLIEKYSLITDFYNIPQPGLKDVNSIITRNGLIAFRIAMILTALRKFDTNDEIAEHVCIDEDFEIAGEVAEIILAHSIIVMKMLPKTNEGVSNTSMNSFFDLLPQKFDRMEGIEIGKQLNLSPRTCDGYLKQLCKSNHLNKPTTGKYQKK